MGFGSCIMRSSTHMFTANETHMPQRCYPHQQVSKSKLKYKINE